MQLQNELMRQQDMVKQLETKLEQNKSKEKTELVQAIQKAKKLEVQVREFKTKLQC